MRGLVFWCFWVREVGEVCWDGLVEGRSVLMMKGG